MHHNKVLKDYKNVLNTLLNKPFVIARCTTTKVLKDYKNVLNTLLNKRLCDC